MSFEVACSVKHAFRVWTSGIGVWWPVDHTVTGEADLLIVLQSGVGGRIYERTKEGEEHDWGEVTVWEPPTQLAYLWHLGSDRSEATEVEIHFSAQGQDATRVDIEHRGWERLANTGAAWRERNQAGWRTLLPHYVTAVGNVAIRNEDQ
jgi:hypothetical protein